MLELAIARTLYDRFPDFSEGRMAKIRSHVVSRASCAVVARELGLGERLLRARGGRDRARSTRLAQNRNVLAAVLEAALAALYLEHGFEHVAGPLVEAFEPRIEYALTNQVDHKTELQETLARSGRSVSYSVLEVGGPAARPDVHGGGDDRRRELGTGTGASKKDAEQDAAREALDALERAAARAPRRG